MGAVAFITAAGQATTMAAITGTDRSIMAATARTTVAITAITTVAEFRFRSDSEPNSNRGLG